MFWLLLLLIFAKSGSKFRSVAAFQISPTSSWHNKRGYPEKNSFLMEEKAPPNARLLTRSLCSSRSNDSDRTSVKSQSLRRSTRLRMMAEQDDFPARSSTPQFTFGIISDIQYAPIPDGQSYSGAPRYYRHSLSAARHAAEHFQQASVPLVLNLGDTIDGKCQELVRHGGPLLPDHIDPGHSAIEDVLDALSAYQHGPILHTYGNHELYNLDRDTIGQKLCIPFVKEPCGDLVGYRSYLHESVRFVVLDTYDLGLMKRCPESSRKYKTAAAILSEHNPNFPEVENSPEGLTGVKKRYVAFNGGIDTPQLEWLHETLQESREARQKVIILSHQPILPGSSSPVCLVWNYTDVLRVLREFSDTVVVSLSGHAHKGGYKRDKKSGIHFRVIEAALESPDPIKTYGLVDVHTDRLVIRGFGDCASAVYEFDHQTPYPKIES